MKEFAISLWELISALKGLFGPGVLIGALVLSFKYLLSLLSKKGHLPSLKPSKVAEFNGKRKGLKRTCCAGIAIALLGLSAFVFALYGVASDETGAVKSMSQSVAIAVYVTVLSALSSLAIQLAIWRKHSALPNL